MNNERYNQIIDEVYKNYCKSFENQSLVEQYSFDTDPTQEEMFINKCKNLPWFSERWGLKIEERELSAIERMEYYGRQYMKEDESMGIDELLKVDYEGLGIPTKLIKITYNNETIEVYERNINKK